MSSVPVFKSNLTDEINVTSAAHEKLLELINSEENVNGVRIFVSGGGCSGMTYGMTFAEKPTQYDTVLQQDNLTVYIDTIALNFLEGVEIDYVQQGMGASFVFKNVFAATGGANTCGACGAAGGGC
ncbi:MAG: iron-sulfur cluster assembly accessory protein [Gammaproteobacteria bacterium]|nr:iron-sulfur cluster assembly accessory protein [Gammaproteobacteria bacterium]